MQRLFSSSLVRFSVLLGSLYLLTGCASYETEHTVYTESGAVRERTVDVGGQIVSELRREFADTAITGMGMFKHENQQLARRAAMQLAVAELASQIQTRVRANTRIYNVDQIRDVVDTRVNALVNNYQIESAGLEGDNYVVELVVTGQTIVEEFLRELRN